MIKNSALKYDLNDYVIYGKEKCIIVAIDDDPTTSVQYVVTCSSGVNTSNTLVRDWDKHLTRKIELVPGIKYAWASEYDLKFAIKKKCAKCK